jgi:hypothetical protein
MSKSRAYVLTVNNPSSNDLPQGVKEDYAIWQLEKGQQGTLHLQAYVRYANAVSFNTAKKTYPTAHIEVAKGTPDQCIAYSSKEDTRQEGPWERGDRPAQGRRNDIEAAKEIILQDLGKKRKPLARVAEQCFSTYVKFHKGLAAAANELVKPREQPPEVRVYVGST